VSLARKRLFSHGELYYGLVFFFLLGAVFRSSSGTVQKKFKLCIPKYLNFPIIFTAYGYDATRNTAQLCALGAHLLRI
jgi:hypothetical protein